MASSGPRPRPRSRTSCRRAGRLRRGRPGGRCRPVKSCAECVSGPSVGRAGVLQSRCGHARSDSPMSAVPGTQAISARPPAAGASARGPGRSALPAALAAGALGLGSAFTLAVYLAPGFDVAYRSAPLHIGVETFGAACGALGAFVLLGRARSAPRLDEHAVAAAFLVLFLENVFLRVVPTVLAGGDTTAFSAWSSAAARVV